MSSFIKANRGLSLAIAAMTAVSFAAVAQTTGSPFASKKKKQAWESDAARPGPGAPPYTAPQYMPPPNYTPPVDMPAAAEPSSYSAPPASSPPLRHSASTPDNIKTYSPPQNQATSYAPYAAYTAPAPTPTSAPQSAQSYSSPTKTPRAEYGDYQPRTQSAQTTQAATPDLLPGYRARPSGAAGSYYPGRVDKGGFSVPAYAPRGQTGAAGQPPYSQQARAPQQNYSNQSYQGQPYQGQSYPPQNAPQKVQSRQGPNSAPSYGRGGWKDRLGFGNLLTTFTAALRVGVAAVQRKNTLDDDGMEDDGWGAGFIADGKVTGEVSAITQGGLEYGIGGELRGQYDKYRRGFGGKVGECGAGSVANVIGCNTLIVDSLAQPLRGHSSQFYSAGLDNAKEAEFAVEGAYVFLRSAYGDVTVGRDDGAAYLFSLGAPTLMAVNASNSPVDYTGLDSVRTVNEASGFSEKIAYVSPRLLGDQIGLGIQVGASYAPNARACGVDYCVRSNGKDGSTALSPDLEDVLEFGLSLDRTFAGSLSIEGTATYATASEKSGLTDLSGNGFDDLKAFGLGLEAKYGPWTLGGSFLNSNNGLTDGDYEAYDIGLTWKPANWGVSASYGHATDKNVNLLSDQATLGFIYDFDKFTLGTGVQYIQRDVVGTAGRLLAPRTEKATALFIEGGVKF